MGAIVPKEIPPTTFPYHAKHNPNASCAYHVRHIGHSIEDCWRLKSRVQELIDQDVLSFSEAGPNVRNNPLPHHSGQVVDVVIGGECSYLFTFMDEYQV